MSIKYTEAYRKELIETLRQASKMEILFQKLGDSFIWWFCMEYELWRNPCMPVFPD